MWDSTYPERKEERAILELVWSEARSANGKRDEAKHVSSVLWNRK